MAASPITPQLDNSIAGYFALLGTHVDKRPQPLAVLTITDRVGGGYLKVANFSLTLVPGVASVARRVELDLTECTLLDVQQNIAEAGYATTTLDPNMASVSAAILVEMDEKYAGTATLAIATAPWYPLLATLALSARATRDRAAAAVAQLDIRTAQGRWLDSLADLYGVTRAEDEDDPTLRARTIFTAGRPHATNISLVEAADAILDVPVTATDGPRQFLRMGVASAGMGTPLHPGAAPYVTITPTVPPAPVVDPIGNEASPDSDPALFFRCALGAVAPPLPGGGGPLSYTRTAFRPPVAPDDPPQSIRSAPAPATALWNLVVRYKAAGVLQQMHLPTPVAFAAAAPPPMGASSLSVA